MLHSARLFPGFRRVLTPGLPLKRPLGPLRTPRSRGYATRGMNDSPFDHLPDRGPKPWIPWKATAVFLVLGCLVGYSETVYDLYARATYIDPEHSANVKLLPLQLEYKLKHLPIYEELAHPRNATKWYKLYLWENLDHNPLDPNQPATVRPQKEYKVPQLTNNTLAQPGGILIKPVIFQNIDTNESVTIVHCGYKLTGYPFLVHGGVIATLLNETFKRNALLSGRTKSNLKDDFMVEHLEISYKAPTRANQFLVVKTFEKPGSEGSAKEVTLQLVIESQDGKVLVKGEALLRDTGRATKQIASENKRWGLFSKGKVE